MCSVEFKGKTVTLLTDSNATILKLGFCLKMVFVQADISIFVLIGFAKYEPDHKVPLSSYDHDTENSSLVFYSTIYKVCRINFIFIHIY